MMQCRCSGTHVMFLSVTVMDSVLCYQHRPLLLLELICFHPYSIFKFFVQFSAQNSLSFWRCQSFVVTVYLCENIMKIVYVLLSFGIFQETAFVGVLTVHSLDLTVIQLGKNNTRFSTGSESLAKHQLASEWRLVSAVCLLIKWCYCILCSFHC